MTDPSNDQSDPAAGALEMGVMFDCGAARRYLASEGIAVESVRDGSDAWQPESFLWKRAVGGEVRERSAAAFPDEESCIIDALSSLPALVATHMPMPSLGTRGMAAGVLDNLNADELRAARLDEASAVRLDAASQDHLEIVSWTDWKCSEGLSVLSCSLVLGHSGGLARSGSLHIWFSGPRSARIHRAQLLDERAAEPIELEDLTGGAIAW